MSYDDDTGNANIRDIVFLKLTVNRRVSLQNGSRGAITARQQLVADDGQGRLGLDLQSAEDQDGGEPGKWNYFVGSSVHAHFSCGRCKGLPRHEGK